MDPIFIILTIVFHFAVIIFLKLIIPPDYESQLKKLKKFEEEKKKKIINNITNANVKNDPISPSMIPKIIKTDEQIKIDRIKKKIIGKVNVKVDTVKERKGDILEINKNSYSVSINEEEEDLFKKECKKLCEKKHNCKRRELKKDFDKFLECKDEETKCIAEC